VSDVTQSNPAHPGTRNLNVFPLLGLDLLLMDHRGESLWKFFSYAKQKKILKTRPQRVSERVSAIKIHVSFKVYSLSVDSPYVFIILEIYNPNVDISTFKQVVLSCGDQTRLQSFIIIISIDNSTTQNKIKFSL